MKNIDKLLEYQKLDIELRKILDEIERSGDSKKMEQARAEFNNAKAAVTDSEKAAESIVAFYNSSVEYIKECDKKIAELMEELQKTDDAEKQAEIISRMEKIREKLVELERKFSERTERTDKVIMSYLDGQERGKKMRVLYNSVKERLEAFKKEREPKINELKSKLAALRPDIPADIMELYKSITAERTYPAFVAAIPTDDKKHYRCYCGLNLSLNTQNVLVEKGHCRCETCRRVIFLGGDGK